MATKKPLTQAEANRLKAQSERNAKANARNRHLRTHAVRMLTNSGITHVVTALASVASGYGVTDLGRNVDGRLVLGLPIAVAGLGAASTGRRYGDQVLAAANGLLASFVASSAEQLGREWATPKSVRPPGTVNGLPHAYGALPPAPQPVEVGHEAYAGPAPTMSPTPQVAPSGPFAGMAPAAFPQPPMTYPVADPYEPDAYGAYPEVQPIPFESDVHPDHEEDLASK